MKLEEEYNKKHQEELNQVAKKVEELQVETEMLKRMRQQDIENMRKLK